MPNERTRSAPTTTTNAGISRPTAAINDDLLAAGVPLPDGVVTPAVLGLAEGDIEEVYYAALSQQRGIGHEAATVSMVRGCGSGAGDPPARLGAAG